MLVAHWMGDSHIVNRVGALIAALGAVFAFVQIRREGRIDLVVDSVASEPVEMTPGDPRQKIVAHKVETALSSLNRQNKEWLMAVTITIAYGEFMHGWGDLFYYAIFD